MKCHCVVLLGMYSTVARCYSDRCYKIRDRIRVSLKCYFTCEILCLIGCIIPGTYRSTVSVRINVRRNVGIASIYHGPYDTFQSQNHVTFSISQDHSLHQVRTHWDHLFLSYAADKQTDKQTNRQPRTSYPRRPTLSAWVGHSVHSVAERVHLANYTFPVGETRVFVSDLRSLVRYVIKMDRLPVLGLWLSPHLRAEFLDTGSNSTFNVCIQ